MFPAADDVRILLCNLETLVSECREVLAGGANAERLRGALKGIESTLRYTVEGAAAAAGLVPN